MNKIEKITQNTRVQAALASFEQHVTKAVDLAITIQQIPAPTFAEARRADYIQSRFENLGLEDVEQDQLHNVYARRPAQTPSSRHVPVVISAHSDTVFPAETDLTIRRDGRFIYGPGLGDNSTGVTGLLMLAQTLAEFDLILPTDLWFVANVGEEGLGDLRGMRAVVERFGPNAIYIVVEGGLYGQISHQAIGVRRFRVEVQAEGGHSWGSFGNPSAIHALGHIITAIDGLEVPKEPKTTYNVGIIEGGTSINTIAQSASLLLDLRSEDLNALASLEQKVKAIVDNKNSEDKVSVSMKLIGDRPAGRISIDSPLVTWAQAALRYIGCQHVEFMAGSTDANIPLSKGLAAICIGLAESGNTHRLDEYLDPTHLAKGMGQLLLLTLAAAEFD